MKDAEAERARKMYESWNRDATEAELREFVHPEMTYTTSGAWPGFDPVYRGREGLLKFRGEMLEAWEYLRLEPSEIERHGDWLIARLDFRGRGRGSGVQVDLVFHHALRFRDGLLYELTACPSREAALRAAGLEPE